MLGHDPDRTYRAAVIGSGSGGLTVAIGLGRLGHHTVLVEGGAVGGDCTNTGCIPSKALLHAAAVDLDDPFGYTQGKRDRLAAEEDHEMVDHDRIHLVRGWARLTDRRDPHVLEVSTADGTVEVRAHNVVIASGSSPADVALPGVPPDRISTTDDLFDSTSAPARLVILGGGAIGLEMATAFNRLGSEVHVVELQEEVLPAMEQEVGSEIRSSLQKRDVHFHLGSTIESASADGTSIELSDGNTISGVDRVLLALGRRPRVEGLGAEQAGLEVTDRGIEADARGATGVDGIWALGDVTGATHTTHGAGSTGRHILRAIAWPRLPRWGRLPSIPTAVFTEPAVAAVGLSPAEVAALPEESRRRYEVALPDVDRGYTDDVRSGFVVVDSEPLSGRILRAVVVGPAAAELIGMFTMAIDNRISLRKLFGMVHPYPSYADAIGQIADAYALDVASDPRGEFAAWRRARLSRRRSTD
jgi:pyruvate/2-oxoglutarate dehydrogenase complex dihydrolipoamide dehydrogenase (E3) component